jgi:hypothetical protein
MYPKVHLETQITMNRQGNTEQEEQYCRYHNTQLQTIIQSLSNKKQYGTGTKRNMKTSGTEWRTQI